VDEWTTVFSKNIEMLFGADCISREKIFNGKNIEFDIATYCVG